MSDQRSAVTQMPGMGALVSGHNPYGAFQPSAQPQGPSGFPGTNYNPVDPSLQQFLQQMRNQLEAQARYLTAQGQELETQRLQIMALTQQVQQQHHTRAPAPPKNVRVPVFPTAPYLPTSGNIGTQTRFYGATLVTGDPDYVVGQEAIRIVNFDIPCYLIAINGGAFNTAAGNALPLGVQANATYLFRLEYSTGDKLMTGPRLATTCIGDGFNPGEIGGTGYVVQPGAGVILGITPLLANLRIDITFHCVEIRAPSNYTIG